MPVLSTRVRERERYSNRAWGQQETSEKANVIQAKQKHIVSCVCVVCPNFLFHRFVSFGALAFHILIIHHATRSYGGYRYIPFFRLPLRWSIAFHAHPNAAFIYHYLWFVSSILATPYPWSFPFTLMLRSCLRLWPLFFSLVSCVFIKLTSPEHVRA